MNKNNFMEKGKKVILTYGSPFVDSDALFIEYHDIIRCLRYELLRLVHDSEVLSEIYNISEIYDLNDSELYEWYVHRKHRNIFKNLEVNPAFVEYNFTSEEDYCKWVDKFENDELDIIPNIENTNKLKFFNALLQMSLSDVTKHIYVYSELYSKIIEEDIKSNFNTKVHYVYGNFKNIVEGIDLNENTSYVFSDVNKIGILQEMNKLKFSSVLQADYYGYNCDDDNEPIIDLENIVENTLFKLYFFDADEMTDDNILFSNE